MDCPLGTLHKVWIKQRRSCFVLRSLLIRVHTKLVIHSIELYIYIAITELNSHDFTGIITNVPMSDIFQDN